MNRMLSLSIEQGPPSRVKVLLPDVIVTEACFIDCCLIEDANAFVLLYGHVACCLSFYCFQVMLAFIMTVVGLKF